MSYSLQTNGDGTILAAAAWEHTVSLWDLRSYSHLQTLETTFDTSLALNDDASILYATASRWKGVAAYRTSDGEELWRRTDLGGRFIRISKNERLLYCFGGTSCETLNRQTGKSKRLFRGVHELWESPFDETLLIAKKGGLYIQYAEGKSRRKISGLSSQIFHVTFSPARIFTFENRGPLRCIDIHSGKELWQVTGAREMGLMDLAFAPSLGRLFATEWNTSRGGPYKLLGFDPDTGHRDTIAEFEAGDSLFCLSGTALVFWSGEVYDVTSGAVLAKLSIGHLRKYAPRSKE